MSPHTDKNLIKLARAIYELVLHEEDKKMLVELDGIGLEAGCIFDDRDNTKGTLHPDLGFNVREFIIFKIEAHDATDAMYREYTDVARETIEYLEKKYDIQTFPTTSPHKKENYLIKLARSLFNLVDNESDTKILASYRGLLLNAKSVFDEYFNKTGKLHLDLGGELFKYYLIKMDGDKSAAESYKELPEDIIMNLEKEYSIH